MSLPSPTLLVLGHVTRDVFGSETRLGGAASFAARAAALLGIDTALVTVAPPDAPELAALSAIPSLRVQVVPSALMTTFALDYAGPHRQLSLVERARELREDDVPVAWRHPALVYAGPVAGECDAELIASFSSAYALGCIQGWLRDPAPASPVRARELHAARHPPHNLRAVAFSAADHPEAQNIAAHLTSLGVTVALTYGRDGARVSWGEDSEWVPASAAREVDATGAGDVFALVFGLSLWAGCAPPEAARRAALAAARVVEGPGLGRLHAVRRELAVQR